MDTSTTLGTVAVAHGRDVLARAELGEQRTHASGLVPAIAEVLQEAGVDRDELAGVVVGAGPGSFTGVRVAAATAKGLAHALGIPMYAFSSLAAGAASVDAAYVASTGLRGAAGRVPTVSDVRRSAARYILFDARGDRLYAGCYMPTAGGFDTLVEPHATTIGELLSGDVPLAVFGGDGTDRHLNEIRGAGFAVLPPGFGMPTADGLLRLIAAQPDIEPIADRGTWVPMYLRDTGAVRMAKGFSEPSLDP
jgi:tRNA threonylcarbamoyl adenosine modification protein YeaZ